MFFFISIENIRLPDYKIWFLKGILSIPVSMVPFESIDFRPRLWFEWFKSIGKKSRKIQYETNTLNHMLWIGDIWCDLMRCDALQRTYALLVESKCLICIIALQNVDFIEYCTSVSWNCVNEKISVSYVWENSFSTMRRKQISQVEYYSLTDITLCTVTVLCSALSLLYLIQNALLFLCFECSQR